MFLLFIKITSPLHGIRHVDPSTVSFYSGFLIYLRKENKEKDRKRGNERHRERERERQRERESKRQREAQSINDMRSTEEERSKSKDK